MMTIIPSIIINVPVLTSAFILLAITRLLIHILVESRMMMNTPNSPMSSGPIA